jgi:hypothetical protein
MTPAPRVAAGGSDTAPIGQGTEKKVAPASWRSAGATPPRSVPRNRVAKSAHDATRTPPARLSFAAHGAQETRSEPPKRVSGAARSAAGSANRWTRSGAAAGGDLDNTGVALHPSGSEDEEQARRDRRETRHLRRGFLWKFSELRSIRACGRQPIADTVSLRLSDGRAALAGLQHCASHACPVCSARIAHERKSELAQAAQRWEEQGGHLLLLTLTMRHTQQDHLAEMWDALSYAWNAVASGKAWTKERDRYGFVGSVRAVELMVKPSLSHGWARSDEHLHTHALLFVRGDLTDEELRDWKRSIFGRWSRALNRKGLEALLIGQDLRKVKEGDGSSFGDYFTKAADNGDAVAMEITYGAQKTGRKHGSITPFGVLDVAIGTGDADALAWWNSYEEIQRGRRRLLWSYKLRELLQLTEERSDEEIAAEELGDASDTLVVFSGEAWGRIVWAPARVPELLNTAELEGLSGVLALLSRWGVPYELPDPPPATG